MARGKKKETLIPEERLQAALVPESEQPYKVPANWCWTYLTKGAAECLDSFRKPINASERANREGDIPYYGATGQVGWIDDFLTNEQLVLVGEDGAPFLDLIKDKAYIIEGKAWVNNHAHIITGKEGFSVEELYLFFSLTNIKSIVTGAVQQKVSQQNLKKVPAIIPSKEALGAFDEITQPIFAQIRNLRDENANLSQLRDTLLPKLMSGELDVSDIEI